MTSLDCKLSLTQRETRAMCSQKYR